VAHPDRVRRVHRQYLEAGARIILTNTFGGTRFRLGMHGAAARVAELSAAGARLARDEVDAAGGGALVAGDIGPTGQILATLGDLDPGDAVAAFAEQAAALADGGVDVIWIETMSALEEVEAAIAGVRRVDPAIPVVVTLSFDTRGHTMMGVSPADAVTSLTRLGAMAVGANCGTGPDELVDVIAAMHRAAPDAALVAKSNAGMPELVDGQVVYGATPATMGAYAVAARAAGARIVGGCCGSTPAHIAAMAEALRR
jgi:5-methyltetrahydrofolate--homocysteine methyltransferase